MRARIWQGCGLLAVLAGIAVCGLSRVPLARAESAKSPFPAPAALPDGSRQLFMEITREAGFVDRPARYPDGRYMTPEITPGGVALFDYDGDGRLDILLICHPPPGP